MQCPFVEVNPVVGGSAQRLVVFAQARNFLEEFVNGAPRLGSIFHSKRRRVRSEGVTPAAGRRMNGYDAPPCRGMIKWPWNVTIAECPDDETAARVGLAGASQGFVRSETLRAFNEAE